MRFSEAMEALVQVRVARDEKRHLTEVAHRRGLTLSEFLREAATDAVRRLAA